MATKEILQEELKNVKKLYVVVKNDKSTRFTLYYLKNSIMIPIYIDEDANSKPSYWSSYYGCFYTNVYNSDRAHDVVRNLEGWLYGKKYIFEYQVL